MVVSVRPSTVALAAVALVASAVGAVRAQQPPPIGIAAVAVAAGPYTFDTAEQHKLRVVVVARGLSHPFSLALLPNGDALVTERGKGLRLVANATGARPGAATLQPAPVAGVPETPAFRNGGLQEVALHPQFGTNGFIYLTYNKAGAEGPAGPAPNQRQAAVTLVRGTWDGKAIINVRELFVGDFITGGSGSRLAFGANGMLFMTTGAPFGDQAQKLDTVYGKVLRLRDDGKVPMDNPFVSRTGARPEIYTYGHRDSLGLTVHPATGTVINAEHGPNGGDEINVILPGRNYGWPTSSFGRTYEGPRISDNPLPSGVEAPLVLWIPSIAPTGLAFYTGDKFPTWKGNLFVGSARRGEVPRTGGLERVVLNDKLEELRRETLLTELHQRIRDVRQGPDGLLYVITDEDDGVLLRLEPAP